MDVIGLSLVTIGSRASEETQRLFEGGEYTKYLYLHGLSVETAEALAEYLHKKMREDLGIAGEDSPHIRDLFHQKYRGSRYSFGYPACPNLEDQTKLFTLAEAGRECWSAADDWILAGAGAEYFGDCGASSGGEVFCGVGRSQPQQHQLLVYVGVAELEGVNFAAIDFESQGSVQCACGRAVGADSEMYLLKSSHGSGQAQNFSEQ